jgi:hypothetical protein
MVDCMVRFDYYSPDFIKSLTDWAHGYDSLDELKKTEYWLWYKENEIIEFSKGNRDFIVHGHNEYEELITILNPKYKKRIKKIQIRECKYETLLVSHYAFDNSYKPKWKKHLYRCDKFSNLTLVECTNAKKS